MERGKDEERFRQRIKGQADIDTETNEDRDEHRKTGMDTA